MAAFMVLPTNNQFTCITIGYQWLTNSPSVTNLFETVVGNVATNGQRWLPMTMIKLLESGFSDWYKMEKLVAIGSNW